MKISTIRVLSRILVFRDGRLEREHAPKNGEAISSRFFFFLEGGD